MSGQSQNNQNQSIDVKNLHFWKLFASVLPSAGYVPVSVGDEEGSIEWRPYSGGGGGGLPDTQNLNINTIDFTSTVMNGEEYDLLYFDTSSNSIETGTFTCTGEIWTAKIFGSEYVLFNGLAYANGIQDPFINGSYTSVDDGAGTIRIFINKYTNNGLVKQSVFNGNTSVTQVVTEILSGDFDRPSILLQKYESGSQIYEKSFINDLDSTVDIQKSLYLYENDGVNSTTNYAPLYQYAEVYISSAQILKMGSNPIELLPAPGVDKYYDFDCIILEYTKV
jgi:hypothetical protein